MIQNKQIVWDERRAQALWGISTTTFSPLTLLLRRRSSPKLTLSLKVPVLMRRTRDGLIYPDSSNAGKVLGIRVFFRFSSYISSEHLFLNHEMTHKHLLIIECLHINQLRRLREGRLLWPNFSVHILIRTTCHRRPFLDR
jgi:hypothetical protein